MCMPESLQNTARMLMMVATMSAAGTVDNGVLAGLRQYMMEHTWMLYIANKNQLSGAIN